MHISTLFFYRAFATQKGLVWLVSSFLFMLYTTTLFAQRFTVSPTSVTVSSNETFTLSYTLENASLSDFQAPNLDDFHIVGGPNQSQSMSIVNGQMSQSVSRSYILQPKKAGVFTIPPGIAITDKKKTLRSPKVKVKVSKGATSSAQTPAAGATSNNGQAPTANGLPSGSQVWVGLVVDTTSLYQGQQLTAIYRLYTNVDISNYNISTPPAFTGFWVQDITPQYRQTPGTVTINDELYRTLDLKKYALFPQRTGALPLDVMKLEIVASIPTGTRDVFGRMRKRNRSLDIVSRTDTLKVYPLPEKGKPENFSGAVGEIKVASLLSNPTVRANESVTYTVSLQGQGNIKLLDPPQINFPESFESFDPIIKDDIYPKNDIVSGRKQFEYTFIPTEAGRFEIPAVEYSFFDPKAEVYKRIISPAKKISVAPGDASLNKPKKEEETDIRALKNGSSMHKGKWYFWASFVFFGLFLVPFIALPMAVNQHRKMQAMLSDVVGYKRKQANKVAYKRLSEAEKHMQANEKRAFYNAVIHAIWGYLSDRFNLPLGELSKDNIASVLQENKVPDTLVNKLIDTIKYCEMALFAPVADADNLQGTYKDTLSLIADVEEVLAQSDTTA